MTDTVPADDVTLFPKTVGERLREAREAQGLSLAEVGARTRVPLRQLEGEYIAYVVAQCGGNKTRAAEILGIDVSTIHRRERERGG